MPGETRQFFGPDAWRAFALAALLAGGCASVDVRSPLDDPRAPTTAVKRCSPSDPDRSDWVCKAGQLLYNLLGARLVYGEYTFR